MGTWVSFLARSFILLLYESPRLQQSHQQGGFEQPKFTSHVLEATGPDHVCLSSGRSFLASSSPGVAAQCTGLSLPLSSRSFLCVLSLCHPLFS